MARQKHSDFPRLLDPEEVLAILKVKPADPRGFLRRLRSRGVITPVKVSREYRYTEQSVKDFLAGRVA